MVQAARYIISLLLIGQVNHDAVAIACEMGKVIKPLSIIQQTRCLPRGLYQRFNGLCSEQKCWTPKKVKGFKRYELVQARGVMGSMGERREKGSFVLNDVASGKRALEVTSRTLTQGRISLRYLALENTRKESGASSPD
jgi:hypothetical protein